MRSATPLHRLTLAAACVGLFAAAGATLAQDAQQTPPPTGDDSATSSSQTGDFKRLDSDADGYVSKDEAAADAQLTSDFARRDVNGDGKLSESEFATAAEAGAPPADDGGKKP